jgi:small ligand-binding sensory domain FIST
MPFAAALSTAPETPVAFAEVAQAVLGQLPQPELAVLFFSPHHLADIEVVTKRLHDKLHTKTLIGCVGDAIVGGSREVEQEPAVSLWAASWNGSVQIDPFHLTLSRTPDGPTLFGWPDSLLDIDPAAAAMLLLGDPHSFPTMELFLPYMNENHAALRVAGGMASGVAQGQTVLLFGDEVVNEGAVGVLLRGPVKLRHVVSQGCRPIGKPFVVTKGHDNIIEELGGRSPLEQLRELWPTLSERDQQLFRHGPHIGMVINECQDRFTRGDFLIRNLYGFDSESGSLAVMDFVRVGQTVQFQVRDAAAADEDLKELLVSDRARHAAKPGGALLFSCNGRGTRLFAKPDHDATIIRTVAGDIPLAGFFAAGELGPVGGRNAVHGFTASVVVFDE